MSKYKNKAKSKKTSKPVTQKRRITKKPIDFVERSDTRTASFVVRRLSEIVTDIGDLLPDMQCLDRYREVEKTSKAIRELKDVRKIFAEIEEYGRTDTDDTDW